MLVHFVNMFNFILLVVPVVISFVNSVDSNTVPFINKCSLSDSKCLKESTQRAIPIFTAGLPELGVEQLEPIRMDKIDASAPSLNLVLKDIVGTGLSNCIAKKINFEGNSKINVKLMCTVDLTAQYLINGNVLILHIEGNGPAHIVLRKIVITVGAHLDNVTGSDGVHHWSIKNYNYGYELKDKSTIVLKNLFSGNEVLAQTAEQFIAASSNEIITEIGPPIIKKVVNKIVKNIGNFFGTVPLDYLVV